MESTMEPAAFAAKKAKILASLAVPAEQYHDLSPKGSVDEGIRELIAQLNGIDGLVTTSSCAGRAAVFVDGGPGAPATDASAKGLGGRWLFVTHDPATLDELPRALPAALQDAAPADISRLVKFVFEPMVLHVAAASLRHVRQLLSAAQAAGFRESGVQSLRCLDAAGAGTTVAVRTAGLGLSCVLGVVEGGHVRLVVDHAYLQLMVRLARDRFAANQLKIDRLVAQVAKMASSRPDRPANRGGARRPPARTHNGANQRPGSHPARATTQDDADFLDGGLDMLG